MAGVTGAGAGHHLVCIWVNHTFANRMSIPQASQKMTAIAQVNVTLGVQTLGFLCMIGDMTVKTTAFHVWLMFV